MSCEAAFGHNFTSGLAYSQNLASGSAFGHKFVSGMASGHNIAIELDLGHNFAFDSAFGLNMTSDLSSGHNELGNFIGHVTPTNGVMDYISLFQAQLIVSHRPHRQNQRPR